MIIYHPILSLSWPSNITFISWMQKWIAECQSAPLLSVLSASWGTMVSLLMILSSMRSWLTVWLKKMLYCLYIIFLSFINCYLLALTSLVHAAY